MFSPKPGTLYIRGQTVRHGLDECTDVVFERCVIDSASFEGCVFQHVYFDGTTVRNANLSFAVFLRCTFKNVQFKDVCATDVEFDSCAFQDCEFTRSTSLPSHRVEHTKTDLAQSGTLTSSERSSGAHDGEDAHGCLDGMLVYRSSLSKVMFRRQTLGAAQFQEADLTDVDFDECDLSDALFDQPTGRNGQVQALRNVTWSRCTAYGQVVSFKGAEFDDCSILACDFPNATLSGAVFQGGVIRRSDLRGSVWTGATFLQTSIIEGDVSDVAMNDVLLVDVKIINPEFGWTNEPTWLRRFWDAIRGRYAQKWRVTVQESGNHHSAFASALRYKRGRDEAFSRISTLCTSSPIAPPIRLLASPAWYVLNQPAKVFKVLFGWVAGFFLQTVAFGLLYHILNVETDSPWLLSIQALPSPGALFGVAKSDPHSLVGAFCILQVFLSWLMAGLFFVHIGKYTSES